MRNRDFIIFLVLLTVTALISVSLLPERAVETGSWGLSFQKEGLPPVGNSSAEALEKLGAAFLGDPTKKRLYLTFDSGYENGCTSQILDILGSHHAPAAFFLVGNYLQQNPELVRRMVREGHTVGNHTMHHPDMTKLTDFDAFSRELTSLDEKFQEITGQPIDKFYRPPQGLYSRENLEMARRLGYKTIFWSLAYADWDNSAQPDPEAAIEKLCRRVHPGAIVLLHATSETNARILDTLLSRWEEMGYRFAPLSALTAGPSLAKSFQPLPGSRIAF